MGLIKSASAPATLSAFSLTDIEKVAKGMLLRARLQAQRVLEEAQNEAQALKKAAALEGEAEGKKAGTRKGIEEGRASGHQQALTEHREKLASLVKTLGETCREVDARRIELESHAADEVVRLAIAIAQRITKRLGQLDSSVVIANVSEALRLVVRACDVQIVVHPSQRNVLNDSLPRLKLQWPSLTHIELIEDTGVSPGGCRIIAGRGQIDADLDQQLQRIAADLTAVSDESLAVH